MMHQHRSSAAAISDPMMASGITEHLASASGPLTGSGGALNQFGQAPYGHAAGYHAGVDPLLSGSSYRQPGWEGAAFDPGLGGPLQPPGALDHHGHQSLAAGAPAALAHQMSHQQHQHQSRYDAHYSSSSSAGRRHQSQHHGATDGAFGGPYQSHSQPPYGSVGQYPALDYGLAGGRSQPPAPMGLGSVSGYGQAAGSYGPAPSGLAGVGAGIGGLELTELRARLQELQVSYANVKRELEMVTQKLGSSMHSIKSFWSPELKKERALRKEEQTKYALINDQMKMMRVEVQVSGADSIARAAGGPLCSRPAGGRARLHFKCARSLARISPMTTFPARLWGAIVVRTCGRC